MTQNSTAKPDSSSKPEGEKKGIVIKKYSNRRLYNTDSSKYIVLADVIDLVNQGAEFTIEEAKTGKDITREILNQIIFEQETGSKAAFFPLEFQKQLIRMYDDAYGHLLPDYLTKSMDYFAQERSEMAQAWQKMMAENTQAFLKQSEALARQNMDLFRRTWDVFGVMETEEKEKPKAQGGLDKLQAQINALQSELKTLKESNE